MSWVPSRKEFCSNQEDPPVFMEDEGILTGDRGRQSCFQSVSFFSIWKDQTKPL